ncbi:MAG: nucleoside 2-deoxyribosyltransferase [Candidatus Aminicenantia bacterium]
MVKKFFIISSLKNTEINNRICNFLESKGHKVHMAFRDTPQDSDEIMYKINIEAIRNADIIIANTIQDFPLTKNWAFELGYAMALGKKIICIGKINEEHTEMITTPLNDNIVSSIEEFEKIFDKMVR